MASAALEGTGKWPDNKGKDSADPNFLVSGAGSAEANGVYVRDGDYTGAPLYKNGVSCSFSGFGVGHLGALPAAPAATSDSGGPPAVVRRASFCVGRCVCVADITCVPLQMTLPCLTPCVFLEISKIDSAGIL